MQIGVHSMLVAQTKGVKKQKTMYDGIRHDNPEDRVANELSMNLMNVLHGLDTSCFDGYKSNLDRNMKEIDKIMNEMDQAERLQEQSQMKGKKKATSKAKKPKQLQNTIDLNMTDKIMVDHSTGMMSSLLQRATDKSHQRKSTDLEMYLSDGKDTPQN